MTQSLEQKNMADMVVMNLGQLRRDIIRNGVFYSENLDQGMGIPEAAAWIDGNIVIFERSFLRLRNVTENAPRFAKLSPSLSQSGITPQDVKDELTALEGFIATVKAMPRTTDPEIRAISAWVAANVTPHDRPLEEELPTLP